MVHLTLSRGHSSVPWSGSFHKRPLIRTDAWRHSNGWCPGVFRRLSFVPAVPRLDKPQTYAEKINEGPIPKDCSRKPVYTRRGLCRPCGLRRGRFAVADAYADAASSTGSTVSTAANASNASAPLRRIEERHVSHHRAEFRRGIAD